MTDALNRGQAVVLPGPREQEAYDDFRARADSALQALDLLSCGLFHINRQGYIKEFNNIAGDLFGIDHTTPWRERHVTEVTGLADTDLYESLGNLLTSGRSFTRLGVETQSDSGCLLDITVCPVPDSHGVPRELIGTVRQSDHAAKKAVQLREELRVLADVAAALSSSLELPQILRIILTGATASQGLGFNRAFLFLYDHEDNALRANLAVGPSSAEEAGRIWSRLDGLKLSLGELLDPELDIPGATIDHLFERIRGLEIDLSSAPMINELCRRGHAVSLSADSSELDPPTSALLSHLGAVNAAFVPLKSKGRCQGLIVADNKITGAPITEDAVRLLKVLADQAAVAIQRGRLHDAERERTCELERTYRRLEESQDKVIRSAKMAVMGELTSAVAEELRNPLKIMAGFVNLMLDSDTPSQQRELLNIVSSEIKRSETLLTHVVEFARASEALNKTFDCSSLVDKAIARVLNRSAHRNADIHFSRCSSELPIHGNPEQLATAFYQLIHLLVDEIEAYGGLHIRTEQAGDKARLEITFFCRKGNERAMELSLDNLLAEKPASLRLPALVAREAVRCHGGKYLIKPTESGCPRLIIQFPLCDKGACL